MSNLFLIGERLNTQRERFHSIVAEHDADAARREARRQIKAGATHLDFNTSRDGAEGETRALAWLFETVLPELPASVGVVLDSSRRECIEEALRILNGRPNTILNSSSAPRELQAQAARDCIELAAQHHAGIIVLLAPGDPAGGGVLERADELREAMTSAGIPDERQFFDPQILPVAFDPLLPRQILAATQLIKVQWPNTHVAAGISNISFNMPSRGALNGAFLAMLMAAGADTFICDPSQRGIRHALAAARAILGMDDFFAEYLSVFTPED